MKFYYHPISSYCPKVLVAMYEKGIEFEPHVRAFMKEDAAARRDATA